jgi:biopolymer transport protein ExbD
MKTIYLNKKRFTPELRMTAMIDVIFLLLIFFICTANFRLLESSMSTDLSAAGVVDSNVELIIPKLSEIDIAIIKIEFSNNSPQWSLAGNKCKSIESLRALLAELKMIQHDLPVIIDSNSNVPMEYVIEVYDSCRSAGLTKIQFAAEKKGE